MAAPTLTREQRDQSLTKKQRDIIDELNEFQTLTREQRDKSLTKKQQAIIDKLNEFLKADKVQKVLEKYWELTKEASKLLNHKGEHVRIKVFAATDCWGTCCTSSGCTTELASQCAGSFTPFPSGC